MLIDTTVSFETNSELVDRVSAALSSAGLTLGDAFNSMLRRIDSGHEFSYDADLEVKERLPIELNDGFGSYICEYGHVHDYSKYDFEALERELADQNKKVYNSVDEMMADILAGDDDA